MCARMSARSKEINKNNNLYFRMELEKILFCAESSGVEPHSSVKMNQLCIKQCPLREEILSIYSSAQKEVYHGGCNKNKNSPFGTAFVIHLAMNTVTLPDTFITISPLLLLSRASLSYIPRTRGLYRLVLLMPRNSHIARAALGASRVVRTFLHHTFLRRHHTVPLSQPHDRNPYRRTPYYA